MNPLPAQLALQDIERRLAALEQAQADELNNNLLSLNPTTGALEENLSGKLEAQGIVLTESPAGAVPISTIEWRDASGVGHEYLFGNFREGIHGLTVESEVGASSAKLEVTSSGPRSLVEAAAVAGVAVGTALIIDSAGKSTFLQLAGALAKRRAVFGTTILKWTVKGFVTEQKAIVTGLPAVSQFIGTPFGASAAFVLGIVSNAAGTVTVEVRSVTVELAAGSEVTVYWMAIGE